VSIASTYRRGRPQSGRIIVIHGQQRISPVDIGDTIFRVAICHPGKPFKGFMIFLVVARDQAKPMLGVIISLVQRKSLFKNFLQMVVLFPIAVYPQSTR
jgi:hypothetical protein